MTIPDTISQNQLIHQLHEFGDQPGGVLLVHTAFSQVKLLEGGPAGLIAALESALAPDGTLVMPSMSGNDDHVFDPKHTPTEDIRCGGTRLCRWRLHGVEPPCKRR